jgi:cell division septation protein DedD
MEYSKLVSVTGLGGLFELMASKNDGAIVRSLDDKSTRFVSSRIHNFSHLESIEVYTEGNNVNLVDVFHAMQNSSEALPDDKDAAAVKTYFKKVYPTMDFDRVYSSDMRKMVKWFDVLTKNNIDIKLSEEQSEEEVQEPEIKEPEVTEPEIQPEVKAEARKKAKPAKEKKEETVAAKENATTESEPKPAKKKVAKKSL